ncbi:MAG TPA: hypothetical protein VMH39_08905 [Gemmatimonadaceae bacterium]|nr:hypothetical protein [Gemmatimonadaceae bacterium]
MLARWIRRLAGYPVPTTEMVRGIEVIVINTRPDIETVDVLARLDEGLGLIERFTPHYFRHLRRDFGQIVVERYACRGAYFPDSGRCLVELTFAVNRDFSTAQVAATIVHEGMHARLHALGFPLDVADRARQERFCRRGEIEFARAVPNGGPILERAMAAVRSADDEVAPAVDPDEAARRIAEVDREALRGRRG